MAAPQLGTALKYLRRLAAPRIVRERSDSQLLEDFSRKHSEDAFVELMKRYGPLVWRVCRHRLGHNQDAEDAFQATFLVLALKAGTIKKRYALASWLHGAAYRSASQIVRQTARRRRHEQGAIAMARTATPNENTWRELQAVVDEELQRLPEKYRAPFVLCCLQEKTKTEAARQLGWKEGTVSGRLALARKQLQKRLTRRGIGLSLMLSVSEVSNVATAEVSAKLATATVQAAMAAAGRKATAGLVSSQVAAVVEALTKATATGKLKLAAFLVFSVGLIATGAEVLSHPQTFSQRDSPVPLPQREAPAEEKVANPALARVAGRVVDEQGQPVADAVVSILELGTTIKRPTTKSAADGSFLLSLDQPAARYVTLLATVGNGVRQGLVEITDTDSPLGNSAQVRIVMKPSRTIRVRVTDGQGKAVEGAAVEVFNTYSPLAGAATGADGRAALRVPVDAHVLWVVGVKPFLGFDYFENYRSWPGYGSNPPPTEVSLVLEGARTVRIQATDSKGQPVPEMVFVPWILAKNGKITHVNLSGAWSLSSIAAKTDREGIATFDWIPKQLKGGIQFVFGGKGYCLPQNNVSFDLAREQDLLTARILKSATFRGKVRFPDGKPGPGILIQAEGRGQAPMAAMPLKPIPSAPTSSRSRTIIGLRLAITESQWKKAKLWSTSISAWNEGPLFTAK